jgi:hypothetical protein
VIRTGPGRRCVAASLRRWTVTCVRRLYPDVRLLHGWPDDLETADTADAAPSLPGSRQDDLDGRWQIEAGDGGQLIVVSVSVRQFVEPCHALTGWEEKALIQMLPFACGRCPPAIRRRRCSRTSLPVRRSPR